MVISTLPSGVPSSAPTIVRATAVDSSRISVSWEPGPFPNGPVLSYVLQINELPEGYPALKVSQRGPYHACAQLLVPLSNNNQLFLCVFFIYLFCTSLLFFLHESQTEMLYGVHHEVTHLDFDLDNTTMHKA